MDRNDHKRIPAELADAAQRLRDERPRMSALELDQLKLRALSAARRPAPRRNPFMKSRFVITTMLVLGVLMSGAGAGLAVSGVSGDGSSGEAQYTTDTTDTQTVLPTTESNPPTPTVTDAEETRQVESSDNELPFTGYAAIPVLLAGIALLSVGVVMRRRTHSQN
jgi:hypothetical protein